MTGKEDLRSKVVIYTDGSAAPTNPGPGGWASLSLYPDGEQVAHLGHEAESTNNRMELMAFLESAKRIEQPIQIIEVFADSKYLIDGVCQWMGGWKSRGWKTSSRKPVKNTDLWKCIYEVVKSYEGLGIEFQWRWVKGHSGDAYNDAVDVLARRAAYAQQPTTYRHHGEANLAWTDGIFIECEGGVDA